MNTMTKPLITIGIAGGTGAGKVRTFVDESNEDIFRSRSHFRHNRVSQSTLAKSVFDALGGEENVTYLVHDSYYKGVYSIMLQR